LFALMTLLSLGSFNQAGAQGNGGVVEQVEQVPPTEAAPLDSPIKSQNLPTVLILTFPSPTTFTTETSLGSALGKKNSLILINSGAVNLAQNTYRQAFAKVPGVMLWEGDVTGTQTSVATGIAEQVAVIKAASNVPVCVGFGVSNPDQAAEIASKADGVVVGSAIVRLIEQNGSSPDLSDRLLAFVKPLVDAVKAV
jgi:hypothetical protein